MSRIGAVDLKRPNLASSYLHFHVSEFIASTAWARVMAGTPFPEATLTEEIFTAVDHLRMMEDVHADDTTQFFWELFNKAIFQVVIKSHDWT